MDDVRAAAAAWEAVLLKIAEVRHGLILGERHVEANENALFLYAKGRNARIGLSDASYRLRAHALFHVPKGQPLSMDASGGELEFYWVAYQAEMPPNAGREMMRQMMSGNPFDRIASIRPENAAFFEAEFRRMLDAWHGEPLCRNLRLKRSFYALLDGFYEAQLAQGQRTVAVDAVKQAQAYLDANFAQPNSLQSLAHALGVGRTTLYEHFKAQLGQSPQQYLMNLRLDAARAFLLNSTMTMQEIAVSCGLIDKGYFSRVFQKRYGMPPGAYRRAHQAPEAISPAPQAETAVTVENLGRRHQYAAVPRRVVCLNFAAAEMLAALGVADRIVGLSGAEGALSDCAAEYREVLARAAPLPPRSAENHTPDFQAILACAPDVAIGTAYSFALPGGIEDAAAFERAGIHVYALKATYTLGSTLDDTYEDIANLGRIMGCPERAASLIAEMRARQRDPLPPPTNRTPVRVFSFDASIRGRAFTCGCSLEASMIRAAGGINVFENRAQQFAAVDWAEVAQANPEVILVHRFFDGDDGERKAEMIRRRPELAGTDAVRNGRIHVIGMKKIFPAIDNPETIQQFARWFRAC